MSFDAAAPGTSEEEWRRSGYRERLPSLDTGPLQRLLVAGAHPDDETLMAGGLIATAAARGVQVVVVVASSGEASHPSSPTLTREALARLREAEVRAAVARLAPQAEVHLLRLPDGGLRGREDELSAALRPLLQRGGTVVTPWREDDHPDHRAVALAAASVAAEVDAIHLEAPIWAWHWGDPRTARWPDGVRLDLPPAVAEAKQQAMELHATQTRPLSDRPGDEVLLLPGVLGHFRVADEVFFPSTPARAVDFAAMYDASDDPWGFEDRWYERRKRAVLNAALPHERYVRLLEIGCSTGVGTADLADRADEVVAIDGEAQAVALARARLREKPNVRVEQRRLPEQWPDEWAAGSFDAIVLSETGFYLAGESLVQVVERCRIALAPGGVLIACHWRPQVLGLDRGGDAVHRVVQQHCGGVRTVLHQEDDFVLEVFQLPPAASVATTTGLR